MALFEPRPFGASSTRSHHEYRKFLCRKLQPLPELSLGPTALVYHISTGIPFNEFRKQSLCVDMSGPSGLLVSSCRMECAASNTSSPSMMSTSSPTSSVISSVGIMSPNSGSSPTSPTSPNPSSPTSPNPSSPASSLSFPRPLPMFCNVSNLASSDVLTLDELGNIRIHDNMANAVAFVLSVNGTAKIQIYQEDTVTYWRYKRRGTQWLGSSENRLCDLSEEYQANHMTEDFWVRQIATPRSSDVSFIDSVITEQLFPQSWYRKARIMHFIQIMCLRHVMSHDAFMRWYNN